MTGRLAGKTAVISGGAAGMGRELTPRSMSRRAPDPGFDMVGLGDR